MTALVACNQKNSKAEDLRLAQQSDSLNRIIAQKDNEINDMMSTMNDIEEGFRAISAAENRVRSPTVSSLPFTHLCVGCPAYFASSPGLVHRFAQ